MSANVHLQAFTKAISAGIETRVRFPSPAFFLPPSHFPIHIGSLGFHLMAARDAGRWRSCAVGGGPILPSRLYAAHKGSHQPSPTLFMRIGYQDDFRGYGMALVRF